VNEKLFFNYLIIGWLILSAIVFIALFFVAAPYGRHARKGWGISINNRLGWLIMEAPAAVVFFLFFMLGSNSFSLVSIVFLIMWEAHYLHRAFIYPFSLSKKVKIMPVSIVSSGFFFNLVNCYLNGRYLFTFSGGYAVSWFADPRFIIGVALFITGYVINRESDLTLRKLRENCTEDYQIPVGALYKFVSCPNYLGEVVIWIGWALATWSLPGLVFALWTAANLIPRARAHHKWYHSYFVNYPEERKALIPKVW
jgi:3-oxo-5-alpha-steroid 4-dehydrogenase 1